MTDEEFEDNDVNNTKTVDNAEFTSFSDGNGKTEKQGDDFEAAVRHYMAQGLSETEARFMAREEV